jgi:hypothetical protein
VFLVPTNKYAKVFQYRLTVATPDHRCPVSALENQMKGLFLFIFLAVHSSATLAQIQYGTVGVAYYTKDKIVMAADSRSLIVGDTTPDDSVCKIAAPYGQVIFVSSNVSGYKNGGFGDFVQSWSNIEEIHQAYSMASFLPSTNHDQLMGTAIQWANLITSHFQSLLLWHPEKISQAIGENGVLTIAEIGGLNSDGALILLQVRILYGKGLTPISYEIGQVTECPKSYCAIGEVEIVQEFINVTSKRAKKEAKKWKPLKKSSPADYDILRTMRLVELTIRYHQGNDVGGKVDAVEMDKDGSVRWFAIKENCAKH